MSELDEIFTAIAFLEGERIEAGTDFDRLARIRARKDALQSRLAKIQHHYELPLDRPALESELAAQRTRRDAIDRTKIDVARHCAGGDIGGGLGDLQELNRGIDEANGRQDIERRISQLRDALARLAKQEAETAAVAQLRHELEMQMRQQAP